MNTEHTQARSSWAHFLPCMGATFAVVVIYPLLAFRETAFWVILLDALAIGALAGLISWHRARADNRHLN